MNPDTEREIWRRVQQNDRLNAEEILLPEKLESTIQNQQLLANLLIRTAQRLNNGERTKLLRAASQFREDIKDLTTLHYLLTGRLLRLRPLPLPPLLPIREELRSIYTRIRKSSREMTSLIRDFSEYDDILQKRKQSMDRAERAVADVLKGKLS